MVSEVQSLVQAIHGCDGPLGCDTAVPAHIVSSPRKTRKTRKTWTVNQRVLIDIAYHHHDSACFTNDISQSEDHRLGSALLRDIVSAFSGDLGGDIA